MATTEDGVPVPASVITQVLCDCELTRIVLDADSVPLDLGRTVRTYTGAHRRAVIARDRTCGWPGCTMPPRWCDIHHIDWWDRDHGHTSVDRGILLCSYHHHQVHRLDLTITRQHVTHGPPRYRFTRPDGHDIDQRPREQAAPGAVPPHPSPAPATARGPRPDRAGPAGHCSAAPPRRPGRQEAALWEDGDPPAWATG